MSNDVETYAGFLTSCSTPEGARQWCDGLSKSRFCPPAFAGKPDEIYMACCYGAQVGLSPMASLLNISMINGRPAVWGDALKGIVIGHCTNFIETIDRSDPENPVAVCKIFRKGFSEPTVATFSWKQACTAGLAGKAGPWKQYPERMLQMRARGFAIRDAFPDVLHGIVSAEEAQDYKVSIEPVKTAPVTDVPPPTDADYWEVPAKQNVTDFIPEEED